MVPNGAIASRLCVFVFYVDYIIEHYAPLKDNAGIIHAYSKYSNDTPAAKGAFHYTRFSVPAAEVLAAETAVLTSYDSSVQEFAGVDALYANPLCIDEVADGIETLTESRDDSATLDRRFDWDKHIEELIDVYYLI